MGCYQIIYSQPQSNQACVSMHVLLVLRFHRTNADTEYNPIFAINTVLVRLSPNDAEMGSAESDSSEYRRMILPSAVMISTRKLLHIVDSWIMLATRRR